MTSSLYEHEIRQLYLCLDVSILYLSDGRLEYEMSIKKTSQSEITYPPKRRGYRFWLIRIALLLGLPLLLYYGYCWGLWGRHSLLLQYLFQCSCPPVSEEARYPKRMDVIVPACGLVSSRLSPSGRFLYAQEEESGITSTYLLDLQTETKIPFTLQEGSNYFLTDELIFYSFYGDNEYILDIRTGTKYPIQNARHLQPSVYSMGNVEPNLLLKSLLQVDQIFLIDEMFQPVIALSSDFRTHPEHSFTFNVSDFSAETTNPVEEFLQKNSITYHYIPANFPHEIVSPDGRFIARDDGIYLVKTNQKIVDGYSVSGFYRSYSGKYFPLRGWMYDSSGVLYSSPFLGPCILETSFFIFEEPGCFVVVTQPLLKLKVPEEYLLPEPIP